MPEFELFSNYSTEDIVGGMLQQRRKDVKTKFDKLVKSPILVDFQNSDSIIQGGCVCQERYF